jgi:transaldolase
MDYCRQYLDEVTSIVGRIDIAQVEKLLSLLVDLRARNGRLFLLGVGGSAANCSHAVNDFRKICGIEAYAPTDNVSELTARANDEGWATIFSEWLRVSHLDRRDMVLVFSVGGGSLERNVSPNLVRALEYAKSVGAPIAGIVGRDGGYTATVADVCVLIPTVNGATVTPHTEAFQAVMWHLIVSHPALQKTVTKWESIDHKVEVVGGDWMTVKDLQVKIFADGADVQTMLELYKNPLIKGFTTNPTLMRKAGVQDYFSFAEEILGVIKDRPISFEVFSDDFNSMEQQALEIASWGSNVYVKVPITNTRGESSESLVESLSRSGVKVNVTAVMTEEQVRRIARCLSHSAASYISVFAGRIADTGRDPIPLMRSALDVIRQWPQIELIWASPRELLNVFHADSLGCHVITVTPDVLKKLELVGKNLDTYSLETVKMFYEDAARAGYSLERRHAVAGRAN